MSEPPMVVPATSGESRSAPESEPPGPLLVDGIGESPILSLSTGSSSFVAAGRRSSAFTSANRTSRPRPGFETRRIVR